MVAKASQPYTSAYVISEFGVRALGESLRQELILDGANDIHVCTVMPASIDTPFFQHAANYTGRAAKALNPVYDAEKVAKTMVRCARRPRREVVVGNAGRLLALQRTLSLGLYEHRSGARDRPRPLPGSGGPSGRRKPLRSDARRNRRQRRLEVRRQEPLGTCRTCGEGPSGPGGSIA